MSFSKIIVIFIIIFLSIYLLLQLYIKRMEIFKSMESNGVEGFAPNDGGTANPLSIQSITSDQANLPLLQYCIKASYNSSYDGNNITLMALDNVLSRGCRFLDFEIYSVDEIPCVSYSTDPTFSTLSSGNSLPLTDVFNEIIGNCFTGNVPNSRDPLFIHLRINTNCGLTNRASCSIYQQVAAIIQTTILPKIHKDENDKAIPITGSTKLSEIVGKIILVMDSSINRDYRNYAVCDASNNTTCYSLRNYINIETGNSEWKKFKFSDFLNKTQNQLIVDSTNSMVAEPTTGVLSLQLVLPDRGANVQNVSFPLSNIESFGCQTVAMKFYGSKNDTGLKKYEELFNEYKTAFIPLGFVVQYLNKEDV
jgi:hypothetical protein